MKHSLLWVLLVAISLVSCKKDKPITSETNEVSTTKNGEKYTLDIENSKVEWKGYKVVKSDNTSHFGVIKFDTGELTVKDGILESGKFVANMASLESIDLKDDADQKGKLEGHLKSQDFFDVEKYPTASYEITKVTATTNGDYNTALEGNLTIKNITKPVTFNANVSVKDGVITIATEPTDVNREDFGVKFAMPLENGILKNEITLQVLIKANENKQ